MTRRLCYVDVESTGLDVDVHQAWEVCLWAEGQDEPWTALLPHTLDHADPVALRIGGYYDRARFVPGRDGQVTWPVSVIETILSLTADATLVGANPRFDAAMLRKGLGGEPWHHRVIDVCTGAMWLLGATAADGSPPGLRDAIAALRRIGYTIPDATHTAEGDVRATRAVYQALRSLNG